MMILKQCQDKTDWDNYIMDHNGHPLQLWGWGNVKSAHGWKAYRLFLSDDTDNIIGAAQLLVRRLPWPLKSICYIPRGPIVGDDNRDDFLLDLEEYSKRVHHAVSISIEPDCVDYAVPKGWKQSNSHILPKRTIILDLKKTEPELLSDMAKKTRQYIRKSAAEAITIKRVNDRKELDKCMKVYQGTAKRAKFDLHDKQYYYDVFDELGDHSPVFAAYVDGYPIAFLWLAISADTAYELYGGMNDLGQQLRSNYALKWHAIRKCKEWGLSRYDFGGMLEGGVTTFKKGWAAEEVKLAGTFDKPLSIFYGLWISILPIAKVVLRKIKVLFHRK